MSNYVNLADGVLQSKDEYIYDVKQHPWYSPPKILLSYVELIKKYGDDRVKSDTKFKKAKEALSVAILLLGMRKLFGEHYLMQVSDDESPDVRSMILKEQPGRPVHGYFQEVEVVHFEKHSKAENIIEFLKQTKLSKKKSYDELTIILCHLDKDMHIPSFKAIHDELATMNPKPQIYLLGRISPDEQEYLVTQVWHDYFDPVRVNAIELANAYPRRPSSLRLTRSSSDKITYEQVIGQKSTVEEVFHLDQVDTQR